MRGEEDGEKEQTNEISIIVNNDKHGLALIL